MASTAFFVRFSITQANRESFIKTNIGRSGKYVLIFTFEEIRVSMYPKAARMDSTIFVGTGSGSEPILEKRSAIVCKRFTSLSISVNREGSISFVRKYSTQAISEDIGVPNWWAVSFDNPTHTLFCSAFFVLAKAKKAINIKTNTTDNCA